MKSPIREYAYRVGFMRQLVADLLAAGSMAAAIYYFQEGSALGAFFFGAFTAWAAARSLWIRHQRRTRISLYPDRVEWLGAGGRRHEASLQEVGVPQARRFLSSKGTKVSYPTPNGRLTFDGAIEGYGDLARRLEGARYGWATRALPPSQLPWIPPTAYLTDSRARLSALMKVAGTFLILIALLAPMTEIWPVRFALVPIFLLLLSGVWDYIRYRHARIELRDGRLVQFDLWNREVGSVGIDTIHYVSFQNRGFRPTTTIEGDDGKITVDPRLERAHDLVSHAYQIITDRHNQGAETLEAPATQSAQVRA